MDKQTATEYSSFLSSLSWAPQPSRNVPADESFLTP